MARTKKAENMNNVEQTNTSKAAKMRAGLKTLCNELVELATQSGRTDYTLNQLLRESYQIGQVELDTFEGWKAKGAQVRKGQHAYLFWGAPVESKKGFKFCPVAFKFTREQVHFRNE